VAAAQISAAAPNLPVTGRQLLLIYAYCGPIKPILLAMRVKRCGGTRGTAAEPLPSLNLG